MIVLENKLTQAKINPLGSELCSFYDKTSKLEYIWQAKNPWKKSAPILFPIIGVLKNNSFIYNEKTYMLEKHGFACNQVFETQQISSTEATFTLRSNKETQKKYPFKFELFARWILTEKTLKSEYTVKNLGNKEMFFSFGFHPAFTLCFDENQGIETMSLVLEKDEDWISTAGVNANATHYPFLQNHGQKKLNLTKTIFDADAVICENLQSRGLTIQSVHHNNSIKASWSKNLNILAVWSMPDAPFVCIEPWSGICDIQDADGKIENKKAIHRLEKKQSELFSFAARIES
ncbi:MAG: aldose 1-epimerase family protein [Treponemataceae bacterium]